MEVLNLDLPTMYGDHHVVEVRRLLLELPGVEEVYASSSFQMVEVKFDGAKLDSQAIVEVLDQAGYLGELLIAVERGALEDRENGDKPFFRHTAAHEQTGQTVSFAQKVPFAGRPLWPCPGLGPIGKSEKKDKAEEEMSYG